MLRAVLTVSAECESSVFEARCTVCNGRCGMRVCSNAHVSSHVELSAVRRDPLLTGDALLSAAANLRCVLRVLSSACPLCRGRRVQLCRIKREPGDWSGSSR